MNNLRKESHLHKIFRTKKENGAAKEDDLYEGDDADHVDENANAAPSDNVSSTDNDSEILRKLKELELKEMGVINDEEFEQMKTADQKLSIERLKPWAF